MSDTITISKSALEALIAEAATKGAEAALAAQPKYTPSDMKFVITSGIPGKSGGKWATIEVTPNGGPTSTFFVDRFHDAPARSDGAAQEIIYASRPKERTAPAEPSATSPAKVKPAAKAKPAAKSAPVAEPTSEAIKIA